ncbi:hypothetical protein D4764_03G0004960 [Takifugu flavidus]|uniref:Fucolectin tachylectin-4 pentraxin-1 domain-containing protein n=1 Tax=Takifugu flavidus TaxID=433684 RepID=A0A5C6N9M5_9TELE|nr:hypothetical protein D4764_03G0004960 [Takifugu flavidus]
MGERLNVWILSGVLAGHVVRNVALKSPAVQSSEKDAAAAGRAVDGNRDPAERSTCTLTQSESGPWWRVDLQDEYKIGAVAITSVDDKKTNLDGVEIWIGISERLNDINNISSAVVEMVRNFNKLGLLKNLTGHHGEVRQLRPVQAPCLRQELQHIFSPETENLARGS